MRLADIRPELPPLLRLAAPLIAGELGWMSMSVVDTSMVGRLPHSAVPMAAAALAQVIFNTFAFGIGGILLGLDTLISQAFGAEIPSANRWLLHGLVLALALGALLIAIFASAPSSSTACPSTAPSSRKPSPRSTASTGASSHCSSTSRSAATCRPRTSPSPSPRAHLRQPRQLHRRLDPHLRPRMALRIRSPLARYEHLHHQHPRLRGRRLRVVHQLRPPLPHGRAAHRHLARRPPPQLRPPHNLPAHRTPASPPALSPRRSRRRADLRRNRRLRRRHCAHRHPRPAPARRARSRATTRQHHLHGPYAISTATAVRVGHAIGRIRTGHAPPQAANAAGWSGILAGAASCSSPPSSSHPAHGARTHLHARPRRHRRRSPSAPRSRPAFSSSTASRSPSPKACAEPATPSPPSRPPRLLLDHRHAARHPSLLPRPPRSPPASGSPPHRPRRAAIVLLAVWHRQQSV